MSSSIAQGQEIVEGVVVVDAIPAQPYESTTEAEQVMNDAFTLLRQGSDSIQQGHALLKIAETRRAWETLGFDDWQSCVLAGVEKHLRTRIEPDYRRALTTDLRSRYGISSRAIASRLGVSHATVQRDLAKERESGAIEENDGDKVVSTDGRSRPARTKPARPRFALTADIRMDKVTKAVTSLHSLMKDDRWKAQAPDMAIKHRADLSRTLTKLAEVLDALAAASPRESPHE